MVNWGSEEENPYLQISKKKFPFFFLFAATTTTQATTILPNVIVDIEDDDKNDKNDEEKNNEEESTNEVENENISAGQNGINKDAKDGAISFSSSSVSLLSVATTIFSCALCLLWSRW